MLSDHGQTQGATFEQRTGQTLAELVGRLCGAAASGDADAEAGRTESTRVAAPGPPHEPDDHGDLADVADRARLGQPRADLRSPATRIG